ncbi:hypothetical protein [Flavobacterium frigoris]|uniref:Exodeoxyribonuclease X-like C-terminal domain-containing protein n=1 Tax=Flavobacterium frigoris (strain PS1) TaxID=1086011 RepID=H7FSW3_FLAFP|nr:hypothetical protein [Flavobacterium frigoris]EIA08672.1 hypothetical protein HJ01_02394 [Flavobacterium frigoris PS1]
MKYYNYDTVLTFGKHKGQTLIEAVEYDADYIDWCAINLDHFYVTPEVIKFIKKKFPYIAVGPEAIDYLQEKLQNWENQKKEKNYDLGEKDYNRSEYYNDSLDMDQQSSEFWDSL